MNDYVRVVDYLTRYGPDYVELLENVLDAAEAARRKLGPAVIADIYSRPKGVIGPFKDPRKIAAKLRKRGNNSASAFLDLNDIIGVTVVIQYPDQRDAVIAALRHGLKRAIKMGSPETHENRKGYFAHHQICSRRYGADRLKCEVQLKTMLHDAWAKKMHDLTYKPGGKLDHRLAALMETGSVTIESVEQQSLLIRNLIQANWNVEKEARRQAREHVFSGLLEHGSQLWGSANAAADVQRLHVQIEDATPWLPSEPEGSRRLVNLMDRVADCCRRPELVRFGWMLTGRLATIRPEVPMVRSCALSSDKWLEVAPDLLARDQAEPREIRAVPLMFYSMNELDLAIDYSDKILENQKFEMLPAKDRAKLAFNRADFLVEREYHFPTEDDEERERLRAEVSAVLSLGELADDESAAGVKDLEGMIDITFAATSSDVRKGIRKCVDAERLSPPDELKLSEAYANLNTRLGWRRYFELEIEEQTAPAGAR